MDARGREDDRSLDSLGSTHLGHEPSNLVAATGTREVLVDSAPETGADARHLRSIARRQIHSPLGPNDRDRDLSPGLSTSDGDSLHEPGTPLSLDGSYPRVSLAPERVHGEGREGRRLRSHGSLVRS